MPSSSCPYGWDAEVKKENTRRSVERPTFQACSSSLAWLQEFASEGLNLTTSHNMQGAFPWLWNPTWGEGRNGNEGLSELRNAVQYVDVMVLALDGFLQCAKDRQRHLRKHWDDTARKVRFPLLSDDILAMIFEFASSSDGWGDDREYYKTPRRLSQISRRLRYIALRTPRLWSVLDSGYQSVEDAQRLLKRNAWTDPPLTAHMRNITMPGWSFKNLTTRFFSFFDLVGTLTSRLSILHFHIGSDNAIELFDEFEESFSDLRKLRFPSLQTLELEFENVPHDYWDPHFYSDWDLPVLETLRVCNIIPQLRSGVLDRLMNCTLNFGKHKLRSQDYISHDEIDQILMFLNTLPALRVLDVTLYGDKPMLSNHDGYHSPSIPSVCVPLPSVHHLSTTAIGLGREASRFWRSIGAQNMSSWTIGLDIPSAGSRSGFHCPLTLDERIADIFSRLSLYPNLKELNLFIHRGFGRTDNGTDNTSLASLVDRESEGSRTQRVFGALENLSVTYPDGEQGFFGQTNMDCHSRCATQLRSVHLKNCKGMIGEVMRQLEGRFAGEPGDGNARLVVDGAKVREAERRSGDPSSDGGIAWASLVLDAKIVRE